ncbi:hypothetical protein IWQ62_005079 [Dispira parvispora]|uniref:DUF4436 domain-containing protein n=1 Tax=Dispira parvispora TaxID=1520584 RepID=A0A9W8AKP2_9FUNG|nr:hypothetical protein IWQ62_005079 [Dispira parvispora]
MSVFKSGNKASDGVGVEFQVVSTDLPSKKMKAHVLFNPGSKLANQFGELKYNLTAVTSTQTISFGKGDQMPLKDITIPFILGNARDYPFDEYVAAYYMGIKKDNDTDFLPLRTQFDGTLFSINLSTEILDQKAIEEMGGQPNMYVVRVDVSRTRFVIFYAVAVSVGMWLIAFASAAMAFQATLRGREVSPNMVTFGATILFAFPTLRETLPGIPQIGCLVDMMGFFWPMGIVALATCVLSYDYVLRWSPLSKLEDLNSSLETVVTVEKPH